MLTLSLHPNNEVRLRISSNLSSKSKDSSETRRSERLAFALPSLPSGISPGDTAAAVAHLSLDANFNALKKPAAKLDKSKIGGWGNPARKTTFGNNARRRMLRGGGALEKLGYGTNEVSAGRVAFFTGTLPASTDAAIKALAAWSGYISNRITQWFRRHDINMWGYVWEWQKRLALHVHLFAASKDVPKLQMMIDSFKHFWVKILLDVTEKSGVDLFGRLDGKRWNPNNTKHFNSIRAEGEWARKCPAGYLSKYVSKNAACKFTSSNAFKVIPADYYPARWWGMSSSLKKASEDLSSSFSTKLTQDQEIEIIQDIHKFLEPVTVKSHSYCDKYNPENFNLIIYVSSELWSDLGFLQEVLKQIPYCQLDAHIGANSSLRKNYEELSLLAQIKASGLSSRFINRCSSLCPSLPYLWDSYFYGLEMSSEDLDYLLSCARMYLSLNPTLKLA
jgi:hypothetical protein